MAASPVQIRLPKSAQEGLIEYCKQTSNFAYATWDFRAALAQIDREYYRENLTTEDIKKQQISLKIGNKKVISDMVVPIVEPQIETSLAYLTSVFLTGHPIFGVITPPDKAQEAAGRAFEAILEENSNHGSWVREFIMFFRNGLKYNFHALEVGWCMEKTYAPYTATSERGVETEQREVIWQGNKIKNLDPYNTLFDPRVQPAEMHKKGEFAGYVEMYSRVALKEFIQNLPSRMNVTEAFESGVGSNYVFFIPEINWDSLVRQNMQKGMDWMAWATLKDGERINYKNCYELATRYCRIIPDDFGIDVPAKKTPQIWKLVTVNDQVLVYAEKMTNAHNYLPILFGQPIEDGLGYQTKSMASRLIPLQDSASAMWNARLAAKRRSVSDRGLYDPLRVRESDINSDNPAAKIPVRSSMYGKSLQDAYYPIPFRDEDSSSFVQDAREMMQFANFVSGQNQAQQGQFVKGNKTLHEFENIMGNSSGRQQMMAQFIEAQVMIPLKQILKLNMLQYQAAGSVYSATEKEMLQIDPVALRNLSMEFKIADGLLPKEKIIEAETLQVALQTMAAVPMLQQQYDVVGVFSYLFQSRGVDLTPFERQMPAAVPGAPQPGTEQPEGATSPAPV